MAVLLVCALPLTAKVRHIDGLLDVEWRQKGSQPISLTIYDETVSPEWPPIIADAVTLWDASTPFQLSYVRGPGPDAFPPPVGTVRVIERFGATDNAFMVPSNQGIIGFVTVQLNPASTFSAPSGWTIQQAMQREARHELGHALTLDHHNIQFVDAPWGGGGEPGCAMASGYGVTQFDLGLLCQRYSCR